jgi:23S rRNA (guanosine2251-2'-O)-methyltransferase
MFDITNPIIFKGLAALASTRTVLSTFDGVTSDLINLADVACRIPMRGEIASLNVGVAAGMMMYEKLRQELYS